VELTAGPGRLEGMSATPKPRIFTEDETADLDLLSTWNRVRLPHGKLREGMVLVDDLGCPVGILDHKIGRASNGLSEWLIHDLERGGIPAVRLQTAWVATTQIS
jgi:hypothetical protein